MRVPVSQRRGSLFTDPCIPVLVQWLVPVLLVAAEALVITSNLKPGATVYAKVDVRGRGTVVGPQLLYQVTLKHSVLDTYNARSYILSVLIAVFSGIWPHLKIAVTALCWFLPTRFLSAKPRSALLYFTYTLQKFSHMETFILVIMMVAFSFDLQPKRHPGISVQTFVRPEPGFFCFLSGFILSMAVSRVAIVYEARASKFHKPPAVASPRPSSESAGKAPFRSPWKDVLMAYTVLVMAGLLVAGLLVPSFSFRFKGLAGWALDKVAGQDPVRVESVYSMGLSIPSSADDPSSLGVHVLQCTYMLFAFGLPLCLVLLLFLLVLLPAPSAPLILAAEMLYAWSAIEVLFMSIVASVFDMKLFVLFMIGDRCDGINKLLRRVFDKELHGDDVCFDLAASLEPGSWLLGPAAVSLLIVSYLILAQSQSHARGMTSTASAAFDIQILGGDEDPYDDGSIWRYIPCEEDGFVWDREGEQKAPFLTDENRNSE